MSVFLREFIKYAALFLVRWFLSNEKNKQAYENIKKKGF